MSSMDFVAGNYNFKTIMIFLVKEYLSCNTKTVISFSHNTPLALTLVNINCCNNL